MERTIAASPAPVTLVPTGPLTNVAHLLERTGGTNVERIVLMGGAIAEGNMTPAAEFNIWADPEAAQAVFHAGIDVCMIGLDVTHRALTTPALQERLRRTGTAGAFVAELVDFFALYHRETYGWDGAPIHDAVAVAHVIQPQIVTTVSCNVEIECESELCRGRTVADRWHRTERARNATVGIDLDAGAFLICCATASSASTRRSRRAEPSRSALPSRPPGFTVTRTALRTRRSDVRAERTMCEGSGEPSNHTGEWGSERLAASTSSRHPCRRHAPGARSDALTRNLK
jgi:hypothetical protein